MSDKGTGLLYKLMAFIAIQLLEKSVTLKSHGGSYCTEPLSYYNLRDHKTLLEWSFSKIGFRIAVNF